MAGQVDGAPAGTVDFDHAASALAFNRQSDRDLSPAGTGFDFRLDSRPRPDRSDQLGFATSPRRSRQGKHRNRFEQVRLALPVGAYEDVEAGARHEVELSVVAVVLELKPAKAHLTSALSGGVPAKSQRAAPQPASRPPSRVL